MTSKDRKELPAGDGLETLGDREIVELCRQGSRPAFEVLYRRYQGKVFSVALASTRNREEALDIVQEAFTKVFRYIGSFKGDSSFYTWLYRITMNLCIDRTRRSARTQSVEYVEGRGDIREDVVQAHSDNPGDNLGRKELLEKLGKAIDDLPEYHRQVIMMREIGGMSYEEIAKAARVSKGTVMSRLFHARRKVREKLTRYLKEPG